MGRVGTIMATLVALGCGSPPPPASSSAAPAAQADDSVAKLNAQQLEWLSVYEQAGFRSVKGLVRVELYAPLQQGAQFAWQVEASPLRLLRDDLRESGGWCEAQVRAPAGLARGVSQEELARRCESTHPAVVPVEFIQELEARLARERELAACPLPPAELPRLVPRDDLGALGPALLPPDTQPRRSAPLTWVAYAHWARELGREDLSVEAMTLAEQQLAQGCGQRTCDGLAWIRTEAQRALLDRAVSGLRMHWMERADALALADRAVAVAPKAQNEVAAQARKLAAALKKDVAQGAAKAVAGDPAKLSKTEKVARLLELLADDNGPGLNSMQSGCLHSNPAHALSRIGLGAVDGLVERLDDQRLTRMRGSGSPEALPLAPVSDVARQVLEKIALRPFGKASARTEVEAWKRAAQGKSFADLGAEALRDAPDSRRLRIARELGQRDLHRLVRELGAVLNSTRDPVVRAHLVALLEASELTAASKQVLCSAQPRPEPGRAAQPTFAPERLLWSTIDRGAQDPLVLPPLERRAMFRALLNSVHDKDPVVRLAAAGALLSWGRQEGVHPVTRDATRIPANETRPGLRVRTISVLIRSGKPQAIEAALRLMSPTQPATLAAAAHGLAQGLATARANQRGFSIPEQGRKKLAAMATAALQQKLAQAESRYALDGVAGVDAEWLLDLVTQGRKYQARAYQTPFERHRAMVELANQQLTARSKQTLSVPIATLPPPPKHQSPTAADSVAITVGTKLANASTAEQWLLSRRGQRIEPTELLEAFLQLAQAHPGHEWRLRVIRHPASRGVTLELEVTPAAAASGSVMAQCYGARPCRELIHHGLTSAELEPRVTYFARELAERWSDHRDQTLDAYLVVVVPQARPSACPK